MSDERSDLDLIEAMRRGDEAAFAAFYHRHRDWIVTLALRFCHHQEDALDVLQETFAYLLKKLPWLELRCQVKTFLYPVVKHLALSRKQAARRVQLHADPPEQAAAGAAPEETLAAEESLRRRLDRLPEGQAEVVRLRFVDDLDLAEIAEALGIPLGTVKSRLHAALGQLRRAGDRGARGDP